MNCSKAKLGFKPLLYIIPKLTLVAKIIFSVVGLSDKVFKQISKDENVLAHLGGLVAMNDGIPGDNVKLAAEGLMISKNETLAKLYKMSPTDVRSTNIIKKYAEKASPAIKECKGIILARGGKVETIEGNPSPRTVLIQFPTMEDALKCYNSPEYQEAMKIGNGEFNRHIQIVEGI